MFQSRRDPRGVAFIAVLGALLVIAILMGYFVSSSQRFREEVATQSSQAASQWKVSSSLNEVRAEILNQVQAKLTQVEGSSGSALGLDVSRATIQTARPHLASEILSLECVAEGSALVPCSRSFTLPKIFRVVMKSYSQSAQTAAITRAEIQISNSTVNAYAFFVKNETRPSVSIAKVSVNGLFGFSFAPEVLSADPSAELRFRTDLGPMIFRKPFVTNIIDPSKLIVSHPNNLQNLQFQEGVILGQSSVSFESLATLFGELRESAVNRNWVNDDYNSAALQTINQVITDTTDGWGDEPGSWGSMGTTGSTSSMGTTGSAPPNNSSFEPGSTAENLPPPRCTEVILSNVANRVTLVEYLDSKCAGIPIAKYKDKPIQFNDVIHARGDLVVLRSASSNFKFKQNSFAIVAEGPVRLGTPLIRDSGSAGYLTVISMSNLEIDSSTRSLASSATQFRVGDPISSFVYPPMPWEKTYQADLSYIGNTPRNSSIVFKDSLFVVNPVSGRGIALGKAEFNGLFISSLAPTSKIVHSNNQISGFAETSWNYPEELQTQNTRWFGAELSGGVLQGIVTHLQRTEENISQALREMAP